MQKTNLLNEMPLTSRPRERLEKYGEKALATHELLAILLRTGPRESNVVQLALGLLMEFEDLYALNGNIGRTQCCQRDRQSKGH